MRADASRHWSGERGQALSFFLVWIVLALSLIGATLAVGQAVNRRSALQLAADAGAYTGASTMAVGLNALAKINKALIELWKDTDARLHPGITCAESTAIETRYEATAAELAHTYTSMNQRWYAEPSGEARRVTRYNLFDLFPGEEARITMDETDRQLGLARQRDTGVLVQSRRKTRFKTWSCTYTYGQLPRARTFETSFEKAHNEVEYFVWVVRIRAGRPMLGERWFGRDAIPAMAAAAAAKPVGGSIENGTAKYVTKLVPLAAAGLGRVRDGVPRVSRTTKH